MKMIPFVWMLHSLQTCVTASASIEWHSGYSDYFASTLVTKGSFISRFQGDASGLVHEVTSTRFYNLSNRVNDWMGILSCPTTTSPEGSVNFLTSAIKNSIHLGASAVIFLCLNISPQVIEEVKHGIAEEENVPVVALNSLENVSAVRSFYERNMIVRAKIRCTASLPAENKMATVSVWTACSRTRNPLSTRPDGVFCAGTSSGKDTVVAVWNASSVAVLSVFFAVLLRMKHFFCTARLLRVVPGGINLFEDYKVSLFNADMIDLFLPSRLANLNELGNICPICLDTVETCQEIRSLPCRHFFHRPCIDEWLIIVPCCPLCKRKVFPEGSL